MPETVGVDRTIVGSESRSRVDVELLDVRAVAALCGCSPRHIYRLTDRGKMPAPIRLGGLVRWSRRVIENWIAEGCPASRPVRGGIAR